MPPVDTSVRGAALRIAAEEGPLEITYESVQAYHGHGALAMLALVFQGLRGALPLLEENGQPVPRTALAVTSGHPGPGVRDAIEFVTRAVTRGCYTVDTSLPEARYSANRDKSYSFRLRRDAWEARAVLRDGVLPPEFFALLGAPGAQARQVHAALRRRIAGEVLLRPPQELFLFSTLRG
ncbi:hypothetical protein [Achromobacter aloeverae]